MPRRHTEYRYEHGQIVVMSPVEAGDIIQISTLDLWSFIKIPPNFEGPFWRIPIVVIHPHGYPRMSATNTYFIEVENPFKFRDTPWVPFKLY